ncbi:5'-AMP-activated protein kinase subunit gamma-2 [Galendromus occidentalis]|uniref:5'-AMP-activated protein kinase subunit gamma-2 n=1 Tax=Galendromus occidentalis TaxID=34638 RepID=A0AAJ6QUH2_9ACAR|nr:5'-AMP-activated protein kinase subunit gamma-2 [Galendromus occidentalis]
MAAAAADAHYYHVHAVHGKASTPDSSEEDCRDSYGRNRSLTLREIPGRVRHSSSTEEDSPLGVSPSRRQNISDSFRPRSKSDSKSKKPTNIMSAIRNSVHGHHWFSNNGGQQSPSSSRAALTPPLSSPTGHSQCHSYATSPDGFEYRAQGRPRSGSESKGGAVAKVIDMFRSRSQSMSLTPEAKAKKFAHSHSGSLLRRHSVDPDRRRSVNRDRSLDDSLHHTALIHRAHSHGESAAYRCASGLASSESSICDRIDIEDLGVDETLLFVKFFRYYYCYDLIPLSAKLVVFDSQLLVKKAFFALVSNGVRAAPLWDSAQQSFVGMLTITDFIHILRKYHKSPAVRMDELEEHKIDTWRTVLTDMQRPLVSIGPDASLCDAITTLIHSKVHRLPVIDPQTGNVLYVLTHKRILRFLFLYFYDLPHASYLDTSIRELKVGTFDNIATCSPGTPLITALNMFIERRVSALPVVDEDDKVVDIYAKFDVINLAAEKTYNNLDMSVGKALEFRNQYFEGVMTCQANDSLLQVMEKIVKAEVHRLVIVDEDDHVDGIVSLSDILTFLVLTPLGIERPASRAYYTRTTSSDRENGTVEEEPELEAKANAHGEQAVETERERQRHDSLDSQRTVSEGSKGKLGSRNNSEAGVPEEDEEENVQKEDASPATADDSPESETTDASKSLDA